jgi:uncharacterized iron-regulated membrane protein
MTARRVLFWIHLIAGCVAGLVILIMSVTGILLAYKRQIMHRADQVSQWQPGPGAQRLPVEQLLAAIQTSQGQMPTGMTVSSDSGDPVSFDFGRERTLLMNPYTGQMLGEASPRLRASFSSVEGWHRWLAMGGERRALGRAITGACNLGFLVLVMTGPILWWPKEWTLNNLKKITLFRGGAWGRARDWNWHNVLGFWCVVPLLLIVVTGVVMSYPWANNLLYRATGNISPPPQGASQGRTERNPGASRRNSDPSTRKSEATRFEGLDKLFARASLQVPDWKTITLRLPNNAAGPLTFCDRSRRCRPAGLTIATDPGSCHRRNRAMGALFQLQQRPTASDLGPL